MLGTRQRFVIHSGSLIPTSRGRDLCLFLARNEYSVHRNSSASSATSSATSEETQARQMPVHEQAHA